MHVNYGPVIAHESLLVSKLIPTPSERKILTITNSALTHHLKHDRF